RPLAVAGERSLGSTGPQAVCGSAHRARVPSPVRPATAVAAPSPRSPTRMSCSGSCVRRPFWMDECRWIGMRRSVRSGGWPGSSGTMQSFGYAAKSGVREVLIRLGNGASRLSAYGIATGDVVLYKELERSLLAPFEGEQADALAACVAEVEPAARADLAAAGV